MMPESEERPARKAPPHMRNHLRVSSPSDNLSPCSQKLMVDLVKGPKPRSFSSRLAQQPSKLSETEQEPGDNEEDVLEDSVQVPASPTRSVGGMTL
ncbi:hypothetical protein PSACC_03252 [Paramicrosporidium saccamoebae]|uniref:Uncharacterized protein n=1 Tax=Paramicrosporidium saccamoebae TaxID=1246581 RepID=A0A2H9TGL0_9FUNG|nr:hypothetical protein PSACC_03252 [Paramicrosporidium saccamoebae]